MDLSPWLTPALVVALFARLWFDLRESRRELSDRLEGYPPQIRFATAATRAGTSSGSSG